MARTLMSATIFFTAALILFVGLDSYGEVSACSVATSITVDSLRLRILTPQPDSDRISRAFQEFGVVSALCSKMKIHLSADDCVGMKELSQSLKSVPVESFEKVTGCRLVPANQSSSQKQSDVGALITQTLQEQQESDGEASYWIADDLLALFLIYPEKMLESLEANVSYRQRFIADLGGNALEDLDDRPNSPHLELKQKRHVLAQVSARLRRNTAQGTERSRILADIARACNCGAPLHANGKITRRPTRP